MDSNSLSEAHDLLSLEEGQGLGVGLGVSEKAALSSENVWEWGMVICICMVS